MEALAISAANLDTIEKNLGSVANELSGVISNVSVVNNQVNKVEQKVADLNDEVKSLVKEIRETTIISNARQAIMYNNSLIEKKYGYYDKVRRITESLLEALDNSSINKKAIISLREEILLHNPNYWLSNALAALISWLSNDKESADKEVLNSLKKDSAKTCLFFSLINLKLNRISTSLNWLNKYLSNESPLELDKNFIVILDLVATGAYGDEAKVIILDKIKEWFTRLNGEKKLQEEQISIWQDFIREFEDNNTLMTYLEIGCPESEVLNNNLSITSSYKNVHSYLNNMIYNEKSNKSISEILSDLIYEYEDTEQVYQNDNLKNQLIISCNGNREKAEELFKKQANINNSKQDLLSLLSNIVIYKDNYKVSNETQKIAVSLIKNYIKEAIDRNNSYINKDSFTIKVDNFTTKTTDGTNINEVKEDLQIYLNNMFNDEDKDLIITLLVINIIGIIGIFITLNITILCGILIAIIIIGNIILFYKLNKRNKLRTIEKNKLENTYLSILEKILAQAVDYSETLKDDELHYNELIVFLNNLQTENYLTSNNERNIIVGE